MAGNSTEQPTSHSSILHDPMGNYSGTMQNTNDFNPSNQSQVNQNIYHQKRKRSAELTNIHDVSQTKQMKINNETDIPIIHHPIHSNQVTDLPNLVTDLSGNELSLIKIERKEFL